MSVSLRRLLGGVESPTAGNYVYGFTNFQFLGGDLKRVDMNAGRMGSSETVYVELTDLRIHKRDFRLGSIASFSPSADGFRSTPENGHRQAASAGPKSASSGNPERKADLAPLGSP